MIFAVSGIVAMATLVAIIGLLAGRRGRLTAMQARFYLTAVCTVLAVILFSALAYIVAAHTYDVAFILLLAAAGLFAVSWRGGLFAPTNAAATANAEMMAAGLAEMRAHRAAQTPLHTGRFVDDAGRSLQLRTTAPPPALTLSVYTLDDPPAAIAYLDLTFSRAYGEDRATLTDLFVRDDYRRAGIAAHLLAEAERAARQQGATKIVGQSDADAFWTHQRGWQVEGKDFYRKL